MLSDDRAAVNGRELLSRLREAIAGKDHYVVATDDPSFALLLRGFAWLLTTLGAEASAIRFDTFEFVDARTLARKPIAALSIEKATTPREIVRDFVRGLGRDLDPDQDLVVAAVDWNFVGGVLSVIARGRAYVPSTDAN